MENIKWLGHASFYLVDQNSNKIYYVDPFNLKFTDQKKADVVFITHAHQDHFSLSDLEKIIKDDTIIVAPPDILREIERRETLKQAVVPNNSYDVNGFKFQTAPAYNTNVEKLHFHPKTNNWVGYIFELNGKKIYHAGDTDFIPEMKDLNKLNLDVALLPIGGKFTMETEEAAEAANAIAAKTTIPMHYKRLNPNNYHELELKFKILVTNSEAVILKELK